MARSTTGPGMDDLEQQFDVVREDLVELTRLFRDIAEAKAGEKRDEALAQASELLERSRATLESGKEKARKSALTVEDYINEKPVQSALIALGIGLFVGMMTRR